MKDKVTYKVTIEDKGGFGDVSLPSATEVSDMISSGAYEGAGPWIPQEFIDVEYINDFVTLDTVKQFVQDHIQSKINHNELHMLNFDMNNVENFKREFEIYKLALTEGIYNGILMMGGMIENIAE